MTDYDISHLPPPVQEALLHLTATMVDAWPAVATAPARCVHSTPEVPCCAACAVVDAAEAVLVDVQAQQALNYPRTPLERHILDVLRHFYPSPVTARQLADRIGLPSDQMRTYAYALFTLGVIERTSQGHYCYKPLTAAQRG